MIKEAAQLFPITREAKLLIIRDILHRIIILYETSGSINDANLNAAFALAHGDFLRTRKFIVRKNNSADRIISYRLTRDNVLISNNDFYVQIRLKSSKADYFINEVIIYVTISETNYLVRLLRRLLTQATKGRSAAAVA